MRMKLKPYFRSLLIALIDYGARTTDEIIAALSDLGWTGYTLIPEVVEVSLQELKWSLI